MSGRGSPAAVHRKAPPAGPRRSPIPLRSGAVILAAGLTVLGIVLAVWLAATRQTNPPGSIDNGSDVGEAPAASSKDSNLEPGAGTDGSR
ncbi:MAG: hypothetical protein JW751_09890 [Polyangiaceae bacterium]|nr:hypothetical protein [Polyangiaceae bacterium]